MLQAEMPESSRDDSIGAQLWVRLSGAASLRAPAAISLVTAGFLQIPPVSVCL